jgi:hypothetical protein
MARTIPSSTSTRTTPAPEAGGGGGGGGATYSDWVEVELDPTEAFWVRKNGTNGAAQTWSKVGSNMQIDVPGGANQDMTGVTRRGTALISAQPIDCWPNGKPDGFDVGKFYQENCIFKVEVEFADGYPFSDTTGVNHGGRYGMIGVGLCYYPESQGGDPAMPASAVTACSSVVKELGGHPTNNTGSNLFKIGWTGNNSRTSNTWTRWKNQGGVFADGPNALVFQTTGLTAGAQSGRCIVKGSAYNTEVTSAYPTAGTSLMSNSTFILVNNNATKFDGNYCHLVIIAGGYSGTGIAAGGMRCKIKRIRYCIQSIAGRVALPGA